MPKKTLPTFVSPMMAKIAEEPFDSPDWVLEVKLDGYPGIAVFDAAGKPHLWSRNGLPLEKKFPAVAKALSKLKLRSTILDGEVVAVDKNGVPRFQLLQRFQKQPRPSITFSMCCGMMARTSRESQSWTAAGFWSRSSSRLSGSS
jgi:bifunctional non-homologous end joining protein LigD